MQLADRRRLGGSRREQSARAIRTATFDSPFSEHISLRKMRASAPFGRCEPPRRRRSYCMDSAEIPNSPPRLATPPFSPAQHYCNSPAPPRLSRTFMKIQPHKTLAAALLCALAATLQLSAEQTGPGRRFLAADDSKQRLAIVAPDGTYEWEFKVGGIHDAQLLPNGNVLLQQGFQRVIEVNREKKTVWEYHAGKMNGNDGKRMEVHAFQRLDNGLTMIAESGIGRIIEIGRAHV